ncbi:MAG: hypothetical protein MJ133_01865 [Lachnospiraceae bacterium]|nr:hypothetical protein [Lachnospiraceae bacterium]
MAKKNREKINGHIHGSNSQEVVERRLSIGVDIIRENNFKMTRKAFMTEYEQRVKRTYGEDITSATLRRDCSESYNGNTIQKMIKVLHNQDFVFEDASPASKKKFLSSFHSIDPFASFSKYLYEIRVSIGTYEATLFSVSNNTLKEHKFAESAIAAIPQKIKEASAEHMAHVYLIFQYNVPNGIEEIYCGIYENGSSSNNFYVLYTDAKNHCSEIVCNGNNLENLLQYTSLIFNNYWKTQK